MDARLQSSLSTLPLTELPTELLSYICSKLYIEDQLRLGEANRFFKQLTNINTLWQQQFKKEFKQKPSFPENAQDQFIAEILFNYAMDAPHESAQAHYRKLSLFLEQHKNKDWSYFYQCLLHYYGAGRKKDISLATKHLISAIQKKDWRAQLFCYQALYRLKNYHPKHFDILHNSLVHHQLFGALFSDLISNPTLAKNSAQNDLLIAWFYRYGKAVTQDFTQAEHYYLEAIKKGELSAPEELVNLHHELPRRRNSLIAREKILNLVNLLDTLSKQDHTIPMLAELHYQLAWQYRILNNTQERSSHLKKAKSYGHIQARYELAEANYHLHINNPIGKKRARNDMIALSKKGHKNAIIKTFHWSKLELEKRIEFIKNLHPDAIYYIAPLIAQDHLNHTQFTLSQLHASIWLQVAAVSGYQNAIDHLLSLSQSGNQYLYIAIACLYQFGGLGSAIEPDPQRSYRFLSYALDKDPYCIQTYLATRKKIGLHSVDTTLFLSNFESNYHPRFETIKESEPCTPSPC